MRILLINYEYPPVGGGASNATWEIARAMVKLGHEPVVLTARYKLREPDTANPGIKVIEVPAIRRRKDRCSLFEMATFVFSATLRIRSLLRREKIEGMIAFFSMPCGPIAWWGWRSTKIPYIISLRGGDVPGLEPRLARFHRLVQDARHVVLRHAAAIVANSTALARAAEAADRCSAQIIPNGVDTHFWCPPADRRAPPPFRLLFVGRFQEQKNLPVLFRSLAQLARTPGVPEWELRLVGDGPQRSILVSLATTLGISTRCVWLPWLSKELLRSEYQAAHWLLNPSTYEGMPNTVLEAVASGLRALLSDIPQHRALVQLLGADNVHCHPTEQFCSVLAAQMALAPVPGLSRPTARAVPGWGEVANAYVELFPPARTRKADCPS